MSGYHDGISSVTPLSVSSPGQACVASPTAPWTRPRAFRRARPRTTSVPASRCSRPSRSGCSGGRPLAHAPPAPAAATVDVEKVAELAAATIAHWVGAGRDRMVARYEISLESTRQPELREAFVRAGQPVRALMVHALAELGAPNPDRQSRDFVAFLDGLIYDQIAGAGGARSRKEIKQTLRERSAGT